MFMGPLEQVKPWQTSGLQGVRRFLDRVWGVGTSEIGDAIDLETKRLVHKTIKKVTQDIELLRFNTAVSAMMILTRQLADQKPVPREGAEALALLLSPFAPHLAEELWQRLGHAESLAHHPWPSWDEALCKDDVVEIAVQVNGKVRGRITLAVDATEDDAKTAALADPNVAQHLAGKPIKKFLYVKGKIANVIV
jgi:leucyl-tRNA synthetase